MSLSSYVYYHKIRHPLPSSSLVDRTLLLLGVFVVCHHLSLAVMWQSSLGGLKWVVDGGQNSHLGVCGFSL